MDRWKDKRWIGFNEYCAYLHVGVEVARAAGLDVRLDYDAHYCRHFARHASRWTLELSDDYRKAAGKTLIVTVDGRTERKDLTGTTVIAVPPGVGSHSAHIGME